MTRTEQKRRAKVLKERGVNGRWVVRYFHEDDRSFDLDWPGGHPQALRQALAWVGLAP